MSEPIFSTHWQKVAYFNGTRIELNNCGQEDRLDMNIHENGGTLGDLDPFIGIELTKSEAKAFAAVLIEFIDDPEVPVPDAWRGI